VGFRRLLFMSCATALLGATVVPAHSTAGSDAVTDEVVTFNVRNANRSLVPCVTDGRAYTIYGHIVGPASRMRDGAAGTLYLHGSAVPEPTWRMPITGYDHGLEEAKLGHISVTVDRLSYGRSPTPNGLMTCVGGQADVVHQIIDELRTGTFGGIAPIRFSRIALAGHSFGDLIAEVEAYSFGDIDALVVGGWGDPVVTARDVMILEPTIRKCLTGGEPKRPGEPGGYAYTFKGHVPELLFHDADPSVISAFVSRHERDACDGSLVWASAMNAVMVSRVHVPVFLFFGLNDALWPAGTGSRERKFYRGSPDVTLLQLPDTGHMMMLERSAPTFRQALSEWFTARGF